MSDQQNFSLTVNGQPYQVVASSKANLMDVLRDQLRFTSVKDGCATGHCGSCMVIKDGKAVRCLPGADEARRRRDDHHDRGVGRLPTVRCIRFSKPISIRAQPSAAFCTPGFIMATKALLDQTPNPTLEDIYDGHQFNICRCTGHNAIIRGDSAGRRPAGAAVARRSNCRSRRSAGPSRAQMRSTR